MIFNQADVWRVEYTKLLEREAKAEAYMQNPNVSDIDKQS
jgi:hypothetical protein